MNEIIGREREKKQLKRLIDSKDPELLALYGRRRIGKTYMIQNYFCDKGVYFELSGMSRGKTQDQLNKFPKAMQKTFLLENPISTPKNWQKAFDLLIEEIEKISEEKKVILFLDELPWLATKRSDLLMVLEDFWNNYLSRRKNAILILCGSAASWMIKKIINNKGGFYGRLTEQIHLQAFSLYETEIYLNLKNIHFDRKQLVELYLVTGGVAKYLNHVRRGMSVAQTIQELCFTSSGFLAKEFPNLFASLFENHRSHMAIVQALAKHRQGLTSTELANKAGLSTGGTYSNILQELEASGFIQMVPFYKQKKKLGLYRLIDEYSYFYLTWVKEAIFSQGGAISRQYWLSMHRDPRFITWAGYAFENICLKHIDRIVEFLKISVVARNAYYWAYRTDNKKLSGAQIDLIIDRTDNCMNLCEIKFSNSRYIMTKEYAEKLNERRNIFASVTKSKKSLFNTLITPYGAMENSSYFSSVDNQMDLDGLFSF